jgi:hypothetical protein
LRFPHEQGIGAFNASGGLSAKIKRVSTSPQAETSVLSVA